MYHMSLSRVRAPYPPPTSFTQRPYFPPPPPLTFPISQHSWAVPHQSKGQFMGLMLQRVQTGLWDRMFGWYLALLKQTSHQNMITAGRGNTFLVLLQWIQAILMSTKYHCFTCFHMFKKPEPNDNKVDKCLTGTMMVKADKDIIKSLALSLNPWK